MQKHIYCSCLSEPGKRCSYSLEFVLTFTLVLAPSLFRQPSTTHCLQEAGSEEGSAERPPLELLRFGAHLALALVALRLIPAPHDLSAAPDLQPLQARQAVGRRGTHAAPTTPT